jgi:Domain of unknown function (DUF4340)
MKRIGLLFVALLLLSGGAYFLYQKNSANQKGMVTADRGFAVESMDEITNIVIKHPKLQPIQFSKNGKSWLLNAKYLVNDAVFINIENVLLDMRLLYVPPKAANATVKESIGKYALEVSLYNNSDQPFKTFYIGSDTQKGDGTYMLMKGEEQAYVMHLPGLMGGLRSRFEQPLKNYRDKFIFREKQDQIASITVTYPKSESSSFSLVKDGKNVTVNPTIANVQKINKPLNERVVNAYLGSFELLGAEDIFDAQEGIDTLLQLVPFCIVEMKKTNGTTKKSVFYSYEDIMWQDKNSRGPKDVAQMERFYAWVDDADMFIVQKRVFGNIFLGYENFFR